MKAVVVISCVLFCTLAAYGVSASAAGLNFEPRTYRYPSPREVVSLDGEWDFRMSGPRCPVSDGIWRKVVTPCIVATNGVQMRLAQEYRRTVELPDLAGRRAVMHFECIPEVCEVRVNGNLVLVHMPGGAPFDVDITKHVVSGENRFELRVRHATDEENVLRGGGAWFVEREFNLRWRFGYCRPVYVDIRPDVSIEDVTVVSHVLPGKVLAAEVELTNATERARAVMVSAAASGWQGDRRNVSIAPLSSATVRLEKTWPDATLWSPDEPNLKMLELSVVENGKLIDARRERFGFRQFTWNGGELRLNGIPFMMKRSGFNILREEADHGESGADEVALRLKRRGMVGTRSLISSVAHIVDAADRDGFLITVLASPPPKARHQNESSWLAMRQWCLDTVKAYKNHPSVFAWCVGGEFASYYGLTANAETNKALTEKCQELGKAVAAADPTRPWTTAGDVEYGWPPSSPGPADIRSFHYPNAPTKQNYLLPEGAWWYKRGELSYQKLSDRNKPLVIGEDLYHGFLDQFFGVSKWGGDKIWTYRGFLEVWRDTVWMIADGFYDAELAGWQIWCDSASAARNDLYDDVCGGQLVPDYLVSIRESFPNVVSGRPETRKLTVYNKRFRDLDAKLELEKILDGKVSGVEKWSLRVQAGGRKEMSVAIDAPATDLPLSYVYRFILKNVADGKVLFSREWDFNVMPNRRFVWPGEIALVGKGDGIESAIASGKPIAVVRNLTSEEGRRLKTYVCGGGRVMLVDVEGGWTPLPFEAKRPCSFVYRRSESSLPGVTDAMLKCWRTNAVVAANGYRKPADRTVQVLLDSGHPDGLTGMQCGRLYDGDGHWFLLQLPVLSEVRDPAAGWVLSCAVCEFLSGGIALDRHLTLGKDDPIASVWENSGIRFDNTVDMRSVVSVNAAQPIGAERWERIKQYVSGGGTVFLHSVAKTNAVPLADLGLTFGPVAENEYCVRNTGVELLDGISNDDLYFSVKKLCDVKFSREKYGNYNVSRAKWKDEFLTGALTGKGVLTDPGAIADVPFGKGRFAVTTIRWEEESFRYPRKTNFLLRNLLRNLGVNAADIAPETVLSPLRMDKEVNRPMWNDPRLSEGTKAWFGGDDDMRYFPVNLCGWSRDSGNRCPVEEVPSDPVNYAGYPYVISQGVFDGAKIPSAIVLEPGETQKIGTWRRNVTRLRFLGALEKGAGAGDEVMKVIIGGFGAEAFQKVMVTGDSVNAFSWAREVRNGRVAWCGFSKIELSAVLYSWDVAVTGAKPGTWMNSIELTNVGKCPIAIVAITLESRP